MRLFSRPLQGITVVNNGHRSYVMQQKMERVNGTAKTDALLGMLTVVYNDGLYMSGRIVIEN
ncbi:MAG: hypothetical protein H7252_02375 [Cytophaga sp.]|nr:hypothetical protein [Undibacterium sp.]